MQHISDGHCVPERTHTGLRDKVQPIRFCYQAKTKKKQKTMHKCIRSDAMQARRCNAIQKGDANSAIIVLAKHLFSIKAPTLLGFAVN